MKKTIHFAFFGAALGILSASAEVDCNKLSQSVRLAVSAEQSKVLEIVAAEVAAAPSCACEVVKAAIEGSNASTEMVAAIVESASTAAPEQMRLISQCAVAVAPDAVAKVQAVIAKLDPNSGESVVTTAKGGKFIPGQVSSDFNPLDFPGQGPIGPPPGSPGANIYFPPGTPTDVPPVINIPEATDPNPNNFETTPGPV
jgi:hypothetical protein